MLMKLCICWLVWLSMPVSLVHASTTEVHELIRRAQQAEADFDYDSAGDLWMEVITHPEISEAQRIEANLRAGHVSRTLGHDIEARMHYMYVLQHRPGYELDPGTSPKIRNFFELVRQEVQSSASISSTDRTDTVLDDARTVPSETGSSTGPMAADSELDTSKAATQPGAALFWGGLTAVAVGTAGLTAGVFAGMAYLAVDGAAQEETVQIDRSNLYSARDTTALVANICYGLGTAAVLVGAIAGGLGLSDGAF